MLRNKHNGIIQNTVTIIITIVLQLKKENRKELIKCR